MNTNTPPENPPAFPQPTGSLTSNGDWITTDGPGMTLRDFFATKAAGDEIAAISYHNLSTVAQEELTGLRFPSEPKEGSREIGDYQIARAKFHMAVSAKLRFMFADAMLLARTGNGGEE